MNNMLNRKGRFFVSFEFIEDTNLTFKEKLEIFKDILILDTRINYLERKIEYSGISEYFDEVDEGYLIPEYECIINEDPQGHLASFEWRKKNDN